MSNTGFDFDDELTPRTAETSHPTPTQPPPQNRAGTGQKRAPEASRMPQERHLRAESRVADAPATPVSRSKTAETPISPHNLDAEQGLLASILIEEDAALLGKMKEMGCRPEWFYSPRHQIIFEAMLSLDAAGEPVNDEISVANKLNDVGRLDPIGGHAYLYDLTTRIQTTVHAKHWLGIVREKFLLRQIIRAASWAQEQAYATGALAHAGGEAMDTLESVYRTFEQLKSGATVLPLATPFPDYAKHFTKENPNNLLGKDFLERGAHMILISFTHVGKSSLCFQASATWSLGCPFFGIQAQIPLRVLIVVHEDGERYTAKCYESVRQGLKLTPEQVEQVRERVHVARVRRVTGAAFWAKVRGLAEAHQADLVVVNPISTYIEGDTNKAEVGNQWFDDADRANPEDKWAYIFVHPTGKPPQQNKQGGTASDEDWQQIYKGIGSSAFAQRPRAGLMIQPLPAQDGKPRQFMLHLGKGGWNAGVTRQVPQQGGVGTREEITVKVPIQHSSGKLVMPWGEEPSFFWEPGEYPDEEVSPRNDGHKGGRPPKHEKADILKYFSATKEGARSSAQILKRMEEDAFKLDKSTFRRYRTALEEDGLITCVPTDNGDLYYRRPKTKPAESTNRPFDD